MTSPSAPVAQAPGRASVPPSPRAGGTPRSPRATSWRSVGGLFGLACVLVLALGCGDGADRPAAGWTGSVDTLEDGRVVVSSPEDGSWGPGSRWRVEERLRIGSAMGGDESQLLSDVRGLAEDGLGRLWLLEREPVELRVYGPGGSLVRLVGREGKGPGELLEPNGLFRGPAGRMWVIDPGRGRALVYDTAGRFVEGHDRKSFGYGGTWKGAVDREGRIYDRFRTEGRWVILVRGPDFAVRDTLGVPSRPGQPELYRLRLADGRAVLTVPFVARGSWTVDPGGYLWFAPGEPYRLYKLSRSWQPARVVERSWTPPRVTEAEVDSFRAGVRDRYGEAVKQLDLSRIPKHKSAVRGFFFGEGGYLWVWPSLEGPPAGRAVDVFDPAGRYLGRLALPVPLRFVPTPVVKEDHVWGLHRDPALGVLQVVRLGLDRGR